MGPESLREQEDGACGGAPGERPVPTLGRQPSLSPAVPLILNLWSPEHEEIHSSNRNHLVLFCGPWTNTRGIRLPPPDTSDIPLDAGVL